MPRRDPGLMKYLFLLLVTFLSISAYSADNEDTSKLMGKWISLESQKGKLQSDWNARRQFLSQKLDLYNAETEALNAVLTLTDTQKSDVDTRRLELLKKQDSLELEQTHINAQISEAISKARTLLTRLPPPLQMLWQEKFSLLSQEGINNSEKLERLLTLFKLVENFNDRIALHRTIMEVSDQNGETIKLLVSQIYMGVAQGWYVSDDGAAYGYGRATNIGWTWWHGENASTELGSKLDPQTILATRAIIENPTTASFLSLPIKIQ